MDVYKTIEMLSDIVLILDTEDKTSLADRAFELMQDIKEEFNIEDD